MKEYAFNKSNLIYPMISSSHYNYIIITLLYPRSDSRTPRNSTVKDSRITGIKRPASRSPPRGIKHNQAVVTSTIRKVDYGEMTLSYLSDTFNAPAINR